MSARKSIIPIFVPHLGCPHMCVFCNQRTISGQKEPVTAQSVKKTIEEALELLPREMEKTVAFYGGSFTAIPAEEQTELLSAAHSFIKDGSIADIRLSTRPDAIDEETLARLRAYGVTTVELGVQSMCEDVLAASGRGHTADDAEKASRLIKEHDFTLILQMMTGLPGDTKDKTLHTAERLISLRPDGVRIYPTVIIENTALHDMYLAGTYREHTAEEAAEWGAELLDMFDAAKIPVIRFGLNPTEELSDGAAVGGAYHPALRELAESHRYLKKLTELVSFRDDGLEVIFGVPYGKVSQVTGQKRRNVKYLQDRFGIREIRFRECDIKPGEVIRISR